MAVTHLWHMGDTKSSHVTGDRLPFQDDINIWVFVAGRLSRWAVPVDEQQRTLFRATRNATTPLETARARRVSAKEMWDFFGAEGAS